VLFDPLGEVVASSIHGVKHGVFVGNMRLSDYVRQGDVTMAGILADPARYLQGASGFFFYDLDAWTRLPALPVHTVTLFRREWAHPPPDGVSTAPAPPTATVEYFDGTLRSLGTKSQVEAEAVAAPAPGEAVEAAPAGDGGATVWVAAGRVVYNQRSEVIRSYLPYVSPTPDFDANPTSPSFRHTYDALGRPVRTETPQGHETLIANAPWSKSYFDEEDTDPSSPFYNTPTIWSYEGHGFVIQETRLNVVNGGPKETLSAYFRVDIAGNRLRTVDPRFYDPLHPETAAHYAFINVFDMMDRPLSALSADAGLHLNLPDAAGRTTDAWDARGFHTAVAFDALHRPVSVHAQGNGLAQITELFEYGTDPDRNTVDELVRHRDEAGVIDLPAYDLLGNPVRVERRVLQECGRVVDWNDPSRVALMPDVWVIRRQYDATSRLVWEANADGSTTEYDFYRNGWLKSVSLRFAGDPIAGAGIVLTYDAAGQRRTATCGNGVERRYGYDQLSLRLQSLVSWHRDRPAVPLQDLRFRHDRVGNVVEVEDRAAPGATTEPSTGVYTYDAIYQLRSASGRQQAGAMAGGCGENLLAPRAVPAAALEPYREEYGIDRSGNLLRLDHTDPSGTVTCSLAVADNCNRAVPTEILEGNDPQAFFDASGNQVSQVPLRLSRFLDYDYRGCLLSAPAGTGPERICFLCDGAGNRVRKAVYADGPAGSVTIQDTLYLGSLVVVRGAGGGGPSLQTNWLRATADDGLFLVAQEKVPAGERGPDAGGGGEAATRRLRYQIDNQVASVTLEMDEAGHLLTYEEYFPYGRPSVLAVDDGDELGEKRYRFNGKELDHPTGLYYYGQRYYAPRAFRWLTPDPAGTVDGLNLYAFVRNSPVTYVDPTGLCRPGARGGNPPQRPFRDRMAEVFGVLLGGFSATRISLGRSPFNLRSALPVLSRFRLSFAATFISWGMYAGHNLIMLSRGNTRPRGQRHITADPDVTAPDPSEILPSQERTPRATPSDRLPSGTINPSSRLGAFQATAGMPRGSTGEGAHFFIGLLYFGFGNFGAHDIGNYFWHPRTQALLLSRNVGYPTQEVARGEYHLWVEVWRRTGHPMAFFGSSFNPTARARFQQAGGVISRIFPEALFPVQVPQSPPPPPKQD
jgi:RHS repeat-associated protein